MKFMGSKAAMLRNGLGEILLGAADRTSHFYDLMSGSGAVASFVAQKIPVHVVASDLQQFSAYLAGAVIARTRPVSGQRIWAEWLNRVRDVPALESQAGDELDVERARRISARSSESFVRAYGGYYYSARQARQLAALRSAIPRIEPDHSVAMAALLRAASRCCSAPGHTAQPLSASTAGAYLAEIWRRDVLAEIREGLRGLAEQYALSAGRAVAADALDVARVVEPGSLVFLDPPYSRYQYSRFYHVLESLTRGWCSPISGTGRYPPKSERPQSRFSHRRQASDALTELLAALATRRARVVVTFPEPETTNGLSGKAVVEAGKPWFSADVHVVAGSFSTLGGRGTDFGRPARQPIRECVITLRPRGRTN